MLRETRVGRYTYAVGSNEEAARLSGIKVSRIKIINYIICATLAGLVGVILASRMVTSQPNSAIGYELNAIASAVIGGTSLMGGVGTVGGTVIGSFIIGILTVGLTMQGANYFMQQIVIGLVVHWSRGVRPAAKQMRDIAAAMKKTAVRMGRGNGSRRSV